MADFWATLINLKLYTFLYLTLLSRQKYSELPSVRPADCRNRDRNRDSGLPWCNRYRRNSIRDPFVALCGSKLQKTRYFLHVMWRRLEDDFDQTTALLRRRVARDEYVKSAIKIAQRLFILI